MLELRPARLSFLPPLGAFILLFGAQSLLGSPALNLEKTRLQTPSGAEITVYLARTPKEKQQGLSGIKAEDMGSDEGMLFIYKEEGDRSIWMPDTWFDLDVYFLDKKLTVLRIFRDFPHYPSRKNRKDIPTTPRVKSQYILEMPSSSPLNEGINVGDRLELLDGAVLSRP